MNRDDFCRLHWSYYLVLEKDFLDTERYISFDLGDNYLYDSHTIHDYGNSGAFSNEFVKQYQAICSEVDVVLKTICKDYTDLVLKKWETLSEQKVRMNTIELQPFKNWKPSPSYSAPDWWTPYNRVKHERLENFRKANLKNVMNALAGLYTLESYLVKYIGDRDKTKDVPNDISNLFELIDFHTNIEVRGRQLYSITQQEIDEMLAEI